ncbi:urea amidolyase [Rhodobacterales bacterium HKCCE2091]|nr:urea amidolyase [Rhodobacterales bacterium HKCCE2091]
MTALLVRRAGPGLTVQDAGRPGWLSQGVSRGGAMDRRALHEAAALLGQSPDLAVLEMAGVGGVFEAEGDIRIALTGAPMAAKLNGAPLAWHASHALRQGDTLEIGAATSGSYGYLALGGGVDAPVRLGARATHLAARLGAALRQGDRIVAGRDPGKGANRRIEVDDRFGGGTLRILPTAQTGDFPQAIRDRLAATRFTRDPRSNRQAVRLRQDGAGFALDGGLTVLSEITQPGEIQVTGDGLCVILMAEAQTAGGYPRIAAILPCDLPVAAQCPAGGTLEFRWIGMDEALAAERAEAKALAALPGRTAPLTRDPREMTDLLSYDLIDGMTTGGDEP